MDPCRAYFGVVPSQRVAKLTKSRHETALSPKKVLRRIELEPVSSEMERVFLANRAALLAYLVRLGPAETAEDILQELWLRLPREGTDIHFPRQYLFRIATSLSIDRERARRQGVLRDSYWLDANGPSLTDQSEQPSAERVMHGREAAAKAFQAVATQGGRVADVFRMHRIDGLPQREVAAKLKISVSTVEGDLRRAYRALKDFRESYDKE